MMLRQKKSIFLGIVFFSVVSGYAQQNHNSSITIKKNKAIENAKEELDKASSYAGVYPDSVIFYTSSAIKTGKEFGDIRTQSRAYAIIADSYQKQTKFKESIEYYLKSIALSEKHNEKQTLCSAYNGLGITYFYLNNMNKASYFIQKSLDIYLERKDYVGYSIVASNLGALLFYSKEYRKAIDALLRTEKTLLKYKQNKILPSLYNSLGANYRMINQLDSAKFYYNQSLDMAIKDGVTDNIISGYHNLGDLSLVRNNFSEAITHLKKAEAVCESSKRDALKLNVYTSLSEAYQLLGDYKNAFLYKEKQFVLNTSIFETEKQKAIDELEIKYEAAKKEKEIQKQRQLIQQSKLKSEQYKGRFNLILLVFLLILFIIIFSFFYIWQRRHAKQLLEKEKLHLFENIVHEIRTPLTLINGPLQLLKKEMNGDVVLMEHVQLIENNSGKLGRLVSELLDASKLERGKYTPAFEYGDINLVVGHVLSSFEQEAKNKQISVKFEPLERTLIHAYPVNIIEKVISNLVSNALKYCPTSSTVKINLQFHQNQLIIAVIDNGQGIPRRQQKHVFKRFYRLKEHTNFAGTGIGLSLVKELVSLVNGSISVESGIKSGASFIVRLPIDLTKKSKENIEMDENKPQLLLVEDDYDIVQFVSGLFINEFNVIIARNGAEGVEMANSFLPDIVLTDIMMPVKDGIELIQEIKGNSLTNHIPVVVFSAKTSLESRLEGLKYGADAYLSKPFNTDELVLTIQNLLNISKYSQQEFHNELQMKKSFEERTKSKNEYVNEVIKFIIINMEDVNYSVNELSSDMCISRSQLHRKLKVLTGFSATNFIRMIRLEKAKDLLESNWGNVTEIAYNCGFSSQSYFTRSFTEYFGENPTSFINKN